MDWGTVFQQYGTMGIVAISMIYVAYYLGRITTQIQGIQESLRELRTGVIYTPACESTHRSLDRRIDTIEERVLGLEQRGAR